MIGRQYWSGLAWASLGLLALGGLGGCGSKHEAALDKARQLAENRDYAGALEVLRSKLREDPEDKELQRMSIEVFVRSGSADRAYEAHRGMAGGEPGVDEVLFELLRDPQGPVRVTAAEALGLVGDASAVDALSQASRDGEKDVRRAAVTALGNVRSPAGTGALLEALKDDWWFVRSEAAQALGKIRDPAAIPALFEALEDEDKSVRLAAENALLSVAGQDGASKEPFASRADAANAEVRRLALIGLAIQGDRSSTPGLVELATDPDVKVRVQVVRALGKTADPAAVGTVRAALADPEAAVQLQAIEAVVRFQDASSVGKLRELAKDGRLPAVIREQAASAAQSLERLGRAKPSS